MAMAGGAGRASQSPANTPMSATAPRPTASVLARSPRTFAVRSRSYYDAHAVTVNAVPVAVAVWLVILATLAQRWPPRM